MGFGTPDEIGDFVSELGIEIFDQIGFGRLLHRRLVTEDLPITGIAVGIDDGCLGQLGLEVKKRAASSLFAQEIKVELFSRGGDRQCGPDVVASPLFAYVRIKFIDNQITENQFRFFKRLDEKFIKLPILPQLFFGDGTGRYATALPGSWRSCATPSSLRRVGK